VTESGPAVSVSVTGLLLFYDMAGYLAITALSVDAENGKLQGGKELE
jgi:hypothetical protein